MRNLLIVAFVCLCVLALSKNGMSYGPHDENCIECHSIHMAKGAKLAAVNLSGEKNPQTGETLKGTDGFCLGCHNKALGIMPVELVKSHPVSVVPKKAKVPAQNLGKDGLFGCMSCHDPHPSNPNYKYLVVDTKGGKDLGAFCSYCHPAQFAPKSAGTAPAKKK